MTSDVAGATAPSPGANSGSGAASAPASAITTNDANFNMFLKLLTTQLKSQDPLNPMDSTDFAVQLATFSGVEQQTKTNSLLQNLVDQLGQGGMSQLAGWIGMEVRSSAPAAFSGTPLTLAPAPEAGADAVTLVVKGTDGTTVASGPIPVSSDPFKWDGMDGSGNPLPAGNYTFELQNYQNGKLVGTDPVEAYSRVTEAQTGDSGPVLVLASGAKVAASDVAAVRAATEP